MIEVGDVVQANENAKDWCGSLLIVEGVKDREVLAGTKIPHRGTAYIILPFESIEYIGKAVLIAKPDECME